MPYYKNLTEVPNTGGEAIVYQIEGSKKGIWYLRIKRHNATGYFRKSTKKKNLNDAIMMAAREWLSVRDAEDRDIVLVPGRKFRVLAEKWLKFRHQQSNALNPDKSATYMFSNYLIPYFGNSDITTINDQRYIRYLNDFRLLNPARKKPKLNTLAVEQQHMNSFLKWCLQKGYTKHQIRLTKINQKGVADKWIEGANRDKIDHTYKTRIELSTYRAYETYRNYFDHVVQWQHPTIKKEPVHVLISRKRAAFYMKTLYNLCCRPGEELLKAKWGDFRKIKSTEKDNAFYVELIVRHGKKLRASAYDNKSELKYFSDYRYIKLLADWKRLLEEHDYPTGRDDYVFPVMKGRRDAKGAARLIKQGKPAQTYIFWDSRASGALIKRERSRVIEWVQSRGKMKRGLEEELERFTWYSVRHVSITRLINESRYPLHFVAEKANTGISMIEDFYWGRGADIEKRIVSRSPVSSEDKREVTTQDEADLEILNDIFDDSV